MRRAHWIGVATVALGLATAGCGSLGTAQVDLRSAVDARQPAMNECYRAALERDSSTGGEVDVRLSMASGTTSVRDVTVRQSQIQDEALTSCLRAELNGVEIERAPGVDMEVDYTLQLRATSH